MDRAQSHLDAPGRVEGWVAGTDAAARRKLEARLAGSQREALDATNLLDAVYESAPVALGFVDRDLRIVRLNAECAALVGKAPGDLVGRALARVIPGLWAGLEPVFRLVLGGGQAVRNLPVSPPKSLVGGAHTEWVASFFPVRSGDEIIGVGLVGVDVTERVQAEGFRATVLGQVSDGVYTLDDQGRLTYMNRAASKMLGWTEDELRGRPMHDVVHFQRADGSPVAAADCALTAAGAVHRLTRTEGEVFTRKDGSTFPVAYSAMPLALGSTVEGISVVFRDLSDPATASGLIRVLVVDADPAATDALTAMLTRHEGLEVVGVARSADAAVDQAVALRADVVVLDVAIPDAGGAATALRIRSRSPSTSILMLVAGHDEAVAAGAIAAGCSGVIDKARIWVELAGAVRAAYLGQSSISPAELQAVVTKVREGWQPGRGHHLTAREREVLRCITQGMSNQQVAARLHVSVNTVRNHVQRILYKLDAHSKLEAVVVATRERLLDPPG